LAKSSGVDLAPVKTVVDVATKEAPGAAKAGLSAAETVFQFLVKSDAETLAETGVGLLALYYLTPYAIAAAATKVRGYAGSLNPPSALDVLLKDGSAVLVDMRTVEERESKGLVSLPNKVRKQLIETSRATLPGGPFSNNSETENKITAVQIAALKGVSKGQKVVLLDQNNKQAKAVAKELTNQGFGKVYLVKGGFTAWVAAGLQTKAALSVRVDGATMGRSRSPTPASRRQTGRGRLLDVEVLPPRGGSVKQLPSGSTKQTIRGSTKQTVRGSVRQSVRGSTKQLPPPRKR